MSFPSMNVSKIFGTSLSTLSMSMLCKTLTTFSLLSSSSQLKEICSTVDHGSPMRDSAFSRIFLTFFSSAAS